MKTLLKVLGGIVLVVLALVAGALTWLTMKKPAARTPSAEKVQATPERLARGKYLAEHVSSCVDCHSDHLTTYGFPVKPGSIGQGGFVFDKNIGFPGVVAAQNITPDRETGLGKVLVRHHREERLAVAVDAFAHGADDLAVKFIPQTARRPRGRARSEGSPRLRPLLD